MSKVICPEPGSQLTVGGVSLGPLPIVGPQTAQFVTEADVRRIVREEIEAALNKTRHNSRLLLAGLLP